MDTMAVTEIPLDFDCPPPMSHTMSIMHTAACIAILAAKTDLIMVILAACALALALAQVHFI